MKKQRFPEEQIIRILRAAETTTIEAATRQHGVSEPSIYRWKRQFGQNDVDDVRELRHLRQENARLKKVVAERDLEMELMKELQAKVVSPRARRQVAQAACARRLSLWRAAWLCATACSWLRYQAKRRERDVRLAQALRGVANRYPQWGYRLTEGFLRRRGWRVNLKRVHRVWRQCGLQVQKRKPRKKIKTGRTLQPTARTKNAVWSGDIVHNVTTAGHAFRCLPVKDEKTRWCLTIEVARSFSHKRIIAVLPRLIARYGCLQYLRSDNGPELAAEALLTFFEGQGITPSRITLGRPWQNGSNESFNVTFRRECLDAERFHSLTEARVGIEDWRQQYNHERPYSALGYQTPDTIYGEGFSRQMVEADSSSQKGGAFIAHKWPSGDEH